MVRFDSPLKNLKIASPCSAEWNAMVGDDRKRFCGQCKLNVYNLSGMTKYDAENLLRLSEGRLCVRYFQRPDGSILTQDCPVGWANAKKRIKTFAAAVGAFLISVLSGLFVLSVIGRKTNIAKRIAIPFATPTPKYEPLMGAIAMPSPTPKASPSPTPTDKPKMGKYIRTERIDDELRQKVLSEAGV